MALASQVPEVALAFAVTIWQGGEWIPSALTVIKIVTVDLDGNSDGEVTPVVKRRTHSDAKRRSHPLRYERLFFLTPSR
jgi:hypothetical protein